MPSIIVSISIWLLCSLLVILCLAFIKPSDRQLTKRLGVRISMIALGPIAVLVTLAIQLSIVLYTAGPAIVKSVFAKTDEEYKIT